jgi:OFA family oxalate/formate antiporter-like MFS transporter
LTANFLILGFGYAIIMTISSLYLAPPKNYKVSRQEERESIEPEDVYKTWQFKALWIIFFINITCGIALLSIISPMAQEVIGISPEKAAGLVGFIGLVNGFGRIFWSTISDYITRGYAYIVFFMMEMVLFFILAGTTNEYLFIIATMIIVSCYGGGFSCMPAYLSDLFGSLHLSTIHGRVLTAWGFAGLAGPLAIAAGKQFLGSYSLILYCFVALFILNLIIATVLAHHNYLTSDEEETDTQEDI